MNIDLHMFIDNIVSLVEAKDSYTAGHSNRVADLVYLLAEELKLPNDEVNFLHIAGHLHDIGKIGIPDGILLKTAKLNRAEFEVIKEHSQIGWNALKYNKSLKIIPDIILHHHERIDGLGYPDGIKGNNIPFGSKIIAIADSFDAMVTQRTYKPAKEFEEAINEIKNNRGKQFDTQIANVFLKMMENIVKYTDVKNIFTK